MKHTASLLAASLLLPTAALAQQGSDFSAFQDSISRMDAPALRRSLEASAIGAADSLAAAPLMQRALMALRLYELTGERRDAGQATSAFERATRRFPELAWAHYGLGLALARGPELRLP
ncbi:MAG: hypothetical protein HY703_03650, partial [Gemmatimonadetes bacterium]|nr:hypothetical protein [Gemmatimonadota bacterium]